MVEMIDLKNIRQISKVFEKTISKTVSAVYFYIFFICFREFSL